MQLDRTISRVPVMVALAVMPACGSDGADTSASPGHDGGRTVVLPPLGEPYTGPPGEWVDRTPCPPPAAWPGAYYAEMVAVADPSRHTVLLLADARQAEHLVFWELDTESWRFENRTACDSAANLPELGTPAVAFDPSRNVAVVVGELDFEGRTFELDARTGRVEDVTPRPPPLSLPVRSAFLFYDAGRGAVTQLDTGAMFTWDPSARRWIEDTTYPDHPPWGPSSRAFDPARRKVYEVGDYQGVLQLLELDLATSTWRSRTPSPVPLDWPSPAAASFAVYDEARDRLVLWAGDSASETTTLEWDPGSGALTRVAAANPDDLPGFAAAVYDPASGLVVAARHQGDDSYLSDVLSWDGTSWTPHRPPYIERQWPWPDSDTAGSHLAVTYDSERGRTVLVGVSKDREARTVTMEWDGEGWEDRTAVDPTASPPPGRDPILAYDSTHRVAGLFGTTTLEGVWEWDGAAGLWVERAGEAERAPYIGAAEHHPGLARTMGYGDETWLWDSPNATWSLAMTDAFGQPFGGGRIAYDERLGTMLLLDTFMDEVQVWAFQDEDNSWERIDPEPPPSGYFVREESRTVYDRARGTLVVLEGAPSGMMVWSFDPRTSTWTDETPAGLSFWPTEIEAVASATYDALRETLVVVLQDGRVLERPSR